jgi:hypothetical protein
MTILRIQTTKGQALFMLREQRLIVWFYGHNGLPTGEASFSVLQPDAIYNGSWNLSILVLVITNYEPSLDIE